MAVLLLSAAGCHSAPASVWNLEQLHEPGGKHRRRARIMGDLEYALDRFFRASNFGGQEFQARQAGEEKIEDPLGTCLENALELGDCERDERVAGLQAATFAWLAVDCPYVLTRERCALELGPLAMALGVPESPPQPTGEPAGPDAVKAAYDELVASAGGVGSPLPDVCARIAALALDRDGALRLLRAANTLLADGDRRGALAPLSALRLELARRCTVLALRAASGDEHGRVRAAALQSAVRAFPDERAALLRTAILATVEPKEPIEERTDYSQRALRLVARNGLPEPPPGTAPDAFEREWIDLLVQVLLARVDGPHNTTACRALARITGQPRSLRPEVWLARWRAGLLGPEGESGSAAGASP